MTDTSKDAVARLCLAMINSGNTTTANMLNALADERDRLATAHTQLQVSLSAANARADHAREAALVEAAERFPDGRQPWPPNAIRKAILALRDKPAPAVTMERVQHIKRGTTYQILARGMLQTDTPLTDYAELVAYRCEETGDVWFRPQSEFTPDRFRAIAGGGDE